jgi:hypothetical protein
MIAVIFEVWPASGRKEDYLAMAAALRTELEAIDGFISVERFQSLTEPCCRCRAGVTKRPSLPGAPTWSIGKASGPAAPACLPTTGCALRMCCATTGCERAPKRPRIHAPFTMRHRPFDCSMLPALTLRSSGLESDARISQSGLLAGYSAKRNLFYILNL